MNSSSTIASVYVDVGMKKAKLPYLKMLVLSIYAGMYIAAGGVISSVCSYGMSGGYSRFFKGITFPLGLMLVCCTGAELFIGNCLLVMPLLCKKITIIEILISWGIVYIGNFIGGILMAVLVIYSHSTDLFNKNMAQTFINDGFQKLSMSFDEAFVKGILCNFFVCLAVWLSFGAKDLFSKIIVIWMPIFLFVSCGLEHTVANMFTIPAGLFASYEYNLERQRLNWGRFIYKNLIPDTLGNILGGAVLVGIAYWYIYLTPN